MPRHALPLALFVILTSGCTSGPIQNQGVPVEVRSAARIVPGCIQIADGLHCQELVPAPKTHTVDRQRVPGIML